MWLTAVLDGVSHSLFAQSSIFTLSSARCILNVLLDEHVEK